MRISMGILARLKRARNRKIGTRTEKGAAWIEPPLRRIERCNLELDLSAKLQGARP